MPLGHISFRRGRARGGDEDEGGDGDGGGDGDEGGDEDGGGDGVDRSGRSKGRMKFFEVMYI